MAVLVRRDELRWGSAPFVLLFLSFSASGIGEALVVVFDCNAMFVK